MANASFLLETLHYREGSTTVSESVLDTICDNLTNVFFHLFKKFQQFLLVLLFIFLSTSVGSRELEQSNYLFRRQF